MVKNETYVNQKPSKNSMAIKIGKSNTRKNEELKARIKKIIDRNKNN